MDTRWFGPQTYYCGEGMNSHSHALGIMLTVRFHQVRCNRRIENIMSKGFVRSIEKYYVMKAINERNEAVIRIASEIPKPTEG